ncbi:alpha-1,2-mannosyltransferase [Arthrobacter sp. CAN_A214]|uniref:glycosyltransferase 87 family protein n=1 Tax=Arthrobacter sp. CAN_A214 TaxID=2787720 RepID=UPI0018CAAD48
MPRASALLAGLGAALALVVLSAQIHGLDLLVYRQGALALLGMAGDQQLYDPSLIETDTRSLPFTYPPFSALVFIPLALLPVSGALVVVTAVSLACLLVVARWVGRYLADRQALPLWASTRWGKATVLVLLVLLIGVSGPWREGLGFGQINPLILVLIVADLLRPPGRVPRGFLIGIAAGIKLTPLAFGLIFLVRRDWRAILALGTGFLATVGIGWLAAPRESARFWFGAIGDPARVGDTTDIYNVSLNAFLAHLGASGALQRSLWILGSLAVIALGYAAIRRAEDDGDLVRAVTANAVVMLAISPISWFHHWVWIALLIPAAWVHARNHAGTTRVVEVAFVALLLPVMMFSSITVTLILTGRVSGDGPPALELFTSLGVLLPVALLVLWLGPRLSLPSGPPGGARP